MTTRVLIAEDSPLFVQALQGMINLEAGLEVVGVALNGLKAVEMCLALKPDVMVMDIQMPRMDGVDASAQIMARAPTPILIVTSDPFHGGVDQSFRALEAGALDLLPKPDVVPWNEHDRWRFVEKIRLLAQIPVVRHVKASARPDAPQSALRSKKHLNSTHPFLGIVASTGGPRALAKLLRTLDPVCGASVFIVQHITHGFCAHLARWLNNNSPWVVEVAQAGERARPGHVYLAPGGLHMEVGPQGTLRLYSGSPIAGHLPNGDVLLRSMARHHARRTCGLILSGMGQDGARGMAALASAGCPTFAQDEQSSVVYGMPQAAIDADGVDRVVLLTRMGQILGDVLGG